MSSTPAPVADWVTIPDLYRDPFPIYERLRAEGGVHWVPSVGRYLITSYDAVHATEQDQETFSANEEGSLQIRAMGHSMLRRDDPEHYPERKAWQPVLRPGVVKRTWTAVFERNAERYLDATMAKGPDADLIWDFAAPYAAENLREILGFHNVTQQDLQRWSQTMIDATGNYADDPEVWAKGERSFAEVDIALDEMLAWHAKNPDHSLISSLLAIPDYRMPIERIRANIKMTIGGGLNEPRDALGVAAWALLTHPEQRRAVEADPSLWAAAFDETIRWISPIGLYSRQTTREVELAGVTLPAGARLGICVGAANRDERVWPDAERFDARREVKPHLAFSKGVHVCLGAWVARAEVAEVGLPRLFERLRGVELDPERPAEIGGWVFPGMLRLPVRWDGAGSTAPALSEPERAAVAPRIAVVGAGPAGCFTAQALRRTLPAATLEVIDRLPVPYGLVRYGVAADHPGTKSVARQFERMFLHDEVAFRGNIALGADISMAELRESYDAVVLATGLHADRSLGIPGAGLPGVVGAGTLTRQLNGHPDEDGELRLGETVTVVGHGNVAIDVVRLVARHAGDFDGTDIDDAARERIAGRVRVIHVVGRSQPGQAKFDPVMVRELAGLPGVGHVVHGVDLEAVPEGKDARWDAVRSLATSDSHAPRVRVEWWFGLQPEALEGTESVRGLRLRDAAGNTVRIPSDTVVTAIGFDVDAHTPAVAEASADGRVGPGLYVAGWLRRGGRGTIPDQRADARALAATIADDLAAVTTARPGLPVSDGEVGFDGWRRIDLREQLGAAPGRTRAKLRTHADLLAAARDAGIVLPEADAASAPSTDGGALPVTVLFGTESGGAELIADDLRTHLADRARVEVRDVAETAPDALDPARLHLVVCSTYGDGEAPTSVRPFLRAIAETSPDLDGLRYAVFGLGDRSYARTYSRGSELVDEALAACGARRVGEYGRHDAGGPMDAVESARDWADIVLAEAEALLTASRAAT
jgi:cytochrome P450/flavodoxin